MLRKREEDGRKNCGAQDYGERLSVARIHKEQVLATRIYMHSN